MSSVLSTSTPLRDGQLEMSLRDQRRSNTLPEPIDPRDDDIKTSVIPAVNVACVPQRSPLRYPGGKTWLVPHIRAWLGSAPHSLRQLVEPFAGGGIVSLTAVMEGLVGRCIMVELDPRCRRVLGGRLVPWSGSPQTHLRFPAH